MDEVRTNSSKLTKEVYRTVKELYPKEKVLQEQTIKINGKNLYLDIYIPRIKVALECQGEQHYKFNKFFHSNSADFIQQKKNDELKKIFCKESGITLVEVLYNDSIDKELIFNKILKALKGE